jgi:hypothetical protein
MGNRPRRWWIELRHVVARRDALEPAEFRKRLRSCIRAFDRYRQRAFEAEARLALAESMMNEREPRAAREIARAEDLLRELKDPWLEYRVAFLAARHAAQGGKRAHARRELERAFLRSSGCAARCRSRLIGAFFPPMAAVRAALELGRRRRRLPSALVGDAPRAPRPIAKTRLGVSLVGTRSRAARGMFGIRSAPWLRRRMSAANPNAVARESTGSTKRASRKGAVPPVRRPVAKPAALA